MSIEVLKDITRAKKQAGIAGFVIKNYLKEYLQYPVLEFVYNSSDYKNFIFTGGSALRICFGAPRLSEDLDFDLLPGEFSNFNTGSLAGEIEKNFKEKYLLPVNVKIQGSGRIYLKFPVLKRLGLAGPSESDLLYVKLEFSKSEFKPPKAELTPVSAFGFNFIARNYSLEFLMTGKLLALLGRDWYKGKANEIDIKGRDFYDLFWYLEKGISPDWRNLKRLAGVDTDKALKKKIREMIEQRISAQKLSYDLKNFFPDQGFISDFCRNYKKIMEKYL